MFGCEFDILGRNIYTDIDFIKKYIIGDFYSTSYIYIYSLLIFFVNIHTVIYMNINKEY